MGLDGIGTFLIPLGSYARNPLIWLVWTIVPFCGEASRGEDCWSLDRRKVFGSGRQMRPTLGFEGVWWRL